MSKTLRWILFVLLGLVALAVVAGVFFAVFGSYRYGMMRPGIWMGDHMRFGYSPIGWIFGGLLCLGIIMLVVIGIVALATALVRGNRPAQVTQPSQATPPSEITTSERPCQNCGRMTREDWKTCPYCGNPLA
jgi:uncharacterized membrane protein